MSAITLYIALLWGIYLNEHLNTNRTPCDSDSGISSCEWFLRLSALFKYQWMLDHMPVLLQAIAYSSTADLSREIAIVIIIILGKTSIVGSTQFICSSVLCFVLQFYLYYLELTGTHLHVFDGQDTDARKVRDFTSLHKRPHHILDLPPPIWNLAPTRLTYSTQWWWPRLL